ARSALAGALTAQPAPGQGGDPALKAWAVDRQSAPPAAEFLEESLGRGVTASLDHDRAVAARFGCRIGSPDGIRCRGVIRNNPDQLASMSYLERRRRVDRENLAAVDDADTVASLDLL